MVASEGGRTLSIIVFCAIVAASLAFTIIAARRARGASGFFVAGRSISARQNGLAIVGDLFSAAAFLGISGMVALNGFDGVMYSIGFLVALITVLLVVAEPLRNIGRYTLTRRDCLSAGQTPCPGRRRRRVGGDHPVLPAGADGRGRRHHRPAAGH
jgi:cation/acetate symporter